MKSMKIKAASVVMLLSLFAVSAMAQPQQGRSPRRGSEPQSAEKKAEIGTDKLDQALELTDAQEAEIYSINLKYAMQREANKPERVEKGERPAKGEGVERPNREAMKEKMLTAQAEKKAHLTEIMSVLDDEQKVEYALLLSKSNNKRNAPQGKQGAQRGPQRMQGEKQGQRGERQVPRAKKLGEAAQE